MTTGSIDIPVRVTEASETIALLNRIATAVEGTGRAADQAEEKAKGFGASLESVGEKARHLNELREAAMSLAQGLLSAAESIAALATEQQTLDANTARLGLNFQEAASSAGGFVSQMQTMTLATAMANRGVNLTQQELNALARIGMQRARDTGKQVEEVFEALGESIIEGGEELTKFGSNLQRVSSDTGTVNERMSILVQNAQRIPPAMQTASDRVNAFKESLTDATRTLSEGFIAEMERLYRLPDPFEERARSAEDMRQSLSNLGRTAALIVVSLGETAAGLVAYIGHAVGTLVVGIASIAPAIDALIHRGDAIRAATTFIREHAGPESLIGMMGSFGERRFSRVQAIGADFFLGRTEVPTDELGEGGAAGGTQPDRQARRGPAAPRGGGGGARAAAPPDMVITAEEITARERALAASDAAYMERRRITDEHIRAMQDELDRDRETLREEVAQRDRERAEQEFAQSDAGLRAQAQSEQIAERERRTMDYRLRSQRSFTDEMENLAMRRMTLAEHEAGMVNGAFNAMGRAFSDHLTAFIEGREELGTALQGMLADTLKTISQEAAVKAGLELAGGFAALATYRFDAAASHFTAAGIYTGVAAAAGLAGAAIAPSSAKANAGEASPAANDNARSATPMGVGGGGRSGETVINIAFNGPQFGTGGVVQAAREVVGVINRGALQGAVQINAAAVGRLR
jgi:hypothetical protein